MTILLVAQISKAEKDSLMSILPAYKEHVQARAGRSLLQYLSCHSMRLRWQWAGKVRSVPRHSHPTFTTLRRHFRDPAGKVRSVPMPPKAAP